MLQYVDDCERELIGSNRSYVICCQDSNGNLYLCSEKKVFAPEEYLGVQVNVQKLNDYFDSYYACAYRDFPGSDTSLPEKYKGTTIMENITESEMFVCSKLFYQRDYHHFADSTYAINKPGKYTIMAIWLFPENFSGDFKSNLNEAVSIFNLTGEIR